MTSVVKMNENLGKIVDDGDVPKINSVEKEEVDSSEVTAVAMFDIISVRDCDEVPKYTLYTIRIRHGSARADIHQTQIERRYTDFLNLYENLRKEFPQFYFAFPRKAIVGNFSERLIDDRRKKFEQFLTIIANDSKLRNSGSFLEFLQENELKSAKPFCLQRRYEAAAPIFKNNFRLLNKVYTDRSPPVLLSLCRLVGCYAEAPPTEAHGGQRWAQLALHRFEGVSDADILMLYTPLLEACLRLCPQEAEGLMARLVDMKRRGVYGCSTYSLLDATNNLDRILRKLDPQKV